MELAKLRGDFNIAQSDLRAAMERIKGERFIPPEQWNEAWELSKKVIAPTAAEETMEAHQAAIEEAKEGMAAMRDKIAQIEEILREPAPRQRAVQQGQRERSGQAAPERQPAGERRGQTAAETGQLPQEIRTDARETLGELRGILKQDAERAGKSVLDEYRTALEAANEILRKASIAGVEIEKDKVFKDLSMQMKKVDGWIRTREESLLTDEIYDEQRELDKISGEIEQLTTEEEIKAYPLDTKLEEAELLLRDLREHSGLRRERAKLQSKVDDIRVQHIKKAKGVGGAEITSREQQKAEREIDSAIASIRKLIGKLQAGTIESDAALPAGVQAIIDENKSKVGRGKWLDLQETQNDLEEARKARREEKEKKSVETAVREAQGKLQLAHQWLDNFEPQAAVAGPLTREQIDELRRKYRETESARTNQVWQAKDYVKDKGLSTNDEVKPENNRMEERLRKLKEAIEERGRELLKKNVDEGLNSANSFLAEIQKRGPDLDEKYGAIAKREAEWGILKNQFEAIHREASANIQVAKDYRKQLDGLRGLIDKEVPEALASAALGGTRQGVETLRSELDQIKTLADLLNKIKQHKEKLEGVAVTLPVNEITEDTDINDWLYNVFARDILADIDAAARYAGQNQLRREDGTLVNIADHPKFRKDVENLEKAAEKFREFLKKKNEELVEDKHRARVSGAVTSEAVQKGEAKAAAEFGITDKETAKLVDRNEIKKEEVLGQIVNTILKRHTFWGKEEGGHRVQEAEQITISEIERAFGPASKYAFTEAQCADLFYAAKAFIWERAAADIERGPREEMPVVPTEGGYKTDKTDTTMEQPQATAKRKWWKTITGAAARGGLATGIVYGGTMLGGPVGTFIGLAVTGAGRMIDNMVRSKIQQKRINEWKRKMTEDPGGIFKKAMVDHLAFTVSNLKENRIRADARGGASDYEFYFNGAKQYLAGANAERAVPLSEAEINKSAAAFGTFYAFDDRLERDRMGHELNQTPNTRHWWNFIDRTLGVSLRNRSGRIGWKQSSGRDKVYAGTTALGASMGLFEARQMTHEIPVVGSVVRRLTQAYAGWKYGGAIADCIAGRKSAEILSEQKLGELEGVSGRLETMSLPQMGEVVKELQEAWAVAGRIRNPIEYARQKERLKQIFMETIAQKILKEEEQHELHTESELRAKGGEIYGEVWNTYQQNREAQLRGEARAGRQRILGRAAGAAGMLALGYVGEQIMEQWLANRHAAAAAAGDKVWGDKGWQDAGAHRPGAGSGGLPEAPAPGGPSRVEGIPAMAVVGRHEGVEHALGRQIEAEADKFGYAAGMGDKHAWAMGEAHRIAIANDYIQEGGIRQGGAETRVGPQDRIAYFFEYGADGKPIIGAGGKASVHEAVGHLGPAGAFLEEPGTRIGAPDAPTPEWYEYRYPGAASHTAEQIEPSGAPGAAGGQGAPSGAPAGGFPTERLGMDYSPDEPYQPDASLAPPAAGTGTVLTEAHATAGARGAEAGAQLESLNDLIAQGKATQEQVHLSNYLEQYQNQDPEFIKKYHDNAAQHINEYISHHPGDANKYQELRNFTEPKSAPADISRATGGSAPDQSGSEYGHEAKPAGPGGEGKDIRFDAEHQATPAAEQAVQGKLNELLPDVKNRESIAGFLNEPSSFPKGTRLTEPAMQELMNTNKTAASEYIRFRTQARVEDFIKDSSNPAKLDALREAVTESVVMEKSGAEAWQSMKDAFRGEKYEPVLKALQEMVKGK